MNDDINPVILGGFGELWGNTFHQGNRVYNTDSVCPTLTAYPTGGWIGVHILVEENERED